VNFEEVNVSECIYVSGLSWLLVNTYMLIEL